MTTESIIRQAELQSPSGLARVYCGICEEYRRRLNEQWGLDIKESWWIPSARIGTTLVLNDLEYSLGMEDVRLFVDLGVDFEDFKGWWNYLINDDKCRINAYNWFCNELRPQDLVQPQQE